MKWTSHHLFIVPCREKASEEEILHVIAKQFYDIDLDEYFDGKRKKINHRTVVRFVVRYAVEHNTHFWREATWSSEHFTVTKYNNNWDLEDELREIQTSFDKTLKETQKAFGWYRLTDE